MSKSQNFSARLRQQITIEQPTLTAGDGGQYTASWSELATVWAEVLPLQNRLGERVSQEQLIMQVQYRITIRYRSDVTAAMRIQFGSGYLNIRQLGSPDGRVDVLEIIADEGVAI